jgi:hypothetical protein
MNELQYESSPYLLQHADNPVNWYPWNDKALGLAVRENKPILLSIGYSTCHWCHVMARESFEDREVAGFMNAFFVNIKVDREERPDLDALYMDACQIISGTGGWPLHVFLTPDLKPFFAGTYFPPEPGLRKMSWFQALQFAWYNFSEKREAVEREADRVLHRLQQGQIVSSKAVNKTGEPDTVLYDQLQKQFDREAGGFGRGPKFPNTMALDFLLNYYHYSRDPNALSHLKFSINRILQGGIYDQVGGGVARYTTDRYWRIPHFEKMLYDNALFAQLLARTYQLTGRRKFKTAFEQIAVFLERDLKRPEGGYYAALDADSEAGEGRYYTWTKAEVEEVLGKDAALYIDFFGITEEGNWEGTNILYQVYDRWHYADEMDVEREDLLIKLLGLREKLLKARMQRKPPHRDEKIILGWNALLVSAYLQMHGATGEITYRDCGLELLRFLQEQFQVADGFIRGRTLAKATATPPPATLQDYAFLIRALLDAFQTAFDRTLLQQAQTFTDAVFEYFLGADEILFNFSQKDLPDVIFARKDLRDEEMPSGNAVMVRNLQDLGLLLDHDLYRRHAARMLETLQHDITAQPLTYAAWAGALLAENKGIMEIAVVGREAYDWALQLQQTFIPFKVMAATETSSDLPLLKDKTGDGQTRIYVCRDYACQQPMSSLEEFRKFLML